jgi:predicted permease
MNDVKFAFRQLLKNPGFTAVAVLTLALGIGANTAIFNLLDAIALRSLPIREPGRLFFVTTGGPVSGLSYATVEHLQRDDTQTGPVFAYRPVKARLNTARQIDVTLIQLVTGNYFKSLGFPAAAGRTLGMDDDRADAPPAAVISYGCWERRFGRSAAALGQPIRLNGTAFTIVGVTPRGFYGLDPQAVPEVFVPMQLQPLLEPGDAKLLTEFGRWALTTVVRLNPGVRPETARTRLSTLFQQVVSANAQQWISAEDLPRVLERGVVLRPAAKGAARLREKFAQPLLVLAIAVGLVFLIACANVANLLLVRGLSRQREVAVRLALGASRGRVRRLLLTESALLAMLGAALGLLLANWGERSLMMFLPADATGVAINLDTGHRTLGFTAVISILATLVFGLAPALRATHMPLTVAMSAGGRTAGGPVSSQRLGHMLVMAQVAFSMLLLIGAGLFVRSLRELLAVDAGFDRRNVLLLTVEPKLSGYRDTQLDDLGFKLVGADLLERLEAIPGVSSASLSSFSQLGNLPGWNVPIKLAARTERGNDRAGAFWKRVSPKHFETLGIPILLGRSFNSTDGGNAPRVAVINEAMARHYFGGNNPVGERFSLTSGLEALGQMEIVGVAKDTKATDLRSEAPRMFYMPFAQFPNAENLVFEIRTALEPSALASAARQLIESVDGGLAVSKVTTLADTLSASLLRERAMATLGSLFGLLALLLASVGLYGVLAYAVTQRTREIGIRIALGAPGRQVRRLVLRQGMRWVAAGVGAGFVGSLALTRFLSSQLFGVSPADPATFVCVTVFLGVVALLACWLPARRAARIDPMEALRYE